MQFEWILVMISLSVRISSAQHVTHANTTRLCRQQCKLSSVPFQSSFSVPANCGNVASFYGCRVEIDVNYTRRAVTVTFSGHTEDSVAMYQVDYDHAVDQALNFAFYRNLFRTTVLFTCLTNDYCTDDYVRHVVQRLIDNEPILYELLPLYLDKTLDNRTITCVNETEYEIPCYGGYCESITEQIVTDWSYHDCRYPSESSVLSTVELTSLTAFFIEFVPENPAADHVNNVRMTLLCNVNLCNGEETRSRGKLILDRYNQAVFNFTHNEASSTVETTLQSTSKSTSNHSSTTSCTELPPALSQHCCRPWQIAVIVLGVVLSLILLAVGIFFLYRKFMK